MMQYKHKVSTSMIRLHCCNVHSPLEGIPLGMLDSLSQDYKENRYILAIIDNEVD